jgi:hypothetical protein
MSLSVLAYDLLRAINILGVPRMIRALPLSLFPTTALPQPTSHKPMRVVRHRQRPYPARA